MGKLLNDDKAIIMACWTEKGWNARRILKEFPGKNWKRSTVHDLIKKIRETNTTEYKEMSKINARSPYYINLSATNLTQVDMELYVYTGTQTTDRSNLFTLTSFTYINTCQ